MELQPRDAKMAALGSPLVQGTPKAGEPVRLSSQLRVRLPIDLRRDLERLAASHDLAFSDYVRLALHKAAGHDMQQQFDCTKGGSE